MANTKTIAVIGATGAQGAEIAAAFTQALEQASLLPWHSLGGVSKNLIWLGPVIREGCSNSKETFPSILRIGSSGSRSTIQSSASDAG